MFFCIQSMPDCWDCGFQQCEPCRIMEEDEKRRLEKYRKRLNELKQKQKESS